MPWTKDDQSDFYSLAAIDEELAEEVKQIALKEERHFRDVLRSAIRQRQFRAESGLRKYWANLTPEERTERARKSSAAARKKEQSGQSNGQEE